MTTLQIRRLAGLLLILVPVAFTICFTLLQMLFQAGGSNLIAVWYALTLSAVLFIPLVVLINRLLATQEASVALSVATVFGIVAGVVQTLGFLRWPFLVPHLAQAYLAPSSSEAQRAAASLVFEAFHRYAGMAVGEHLGYLSTSVWTFLVALLMLRAPLFGRWLGLSGMVLALGVATGLLEPAGWELAGTINAISYLAWAVWLIAVGVAVLVRRSELTPLLHPAATAQ
jgi:Domain of unknown function (DUF4386)